MSSAAGLDTWRRRYERIGIPTIPLYPGSKQPVSEEWQATPPPLQWQTAGERAGNIGLRTGNGFGVGDADAVQTVGALGRVLAGWGMIPPTVLTPSDGRHYYLRVADAPKGVSYCLWRADVGPGELRIGPGAQVAAPCSAVGGKRYSFLPGTSPEDWLRMRPLRWRDLVKLTRAQPAVPLESLPIPLPRRDLDGWAVWLLGALAHISASAPVRVMRNGVVIQYANRSDAEQAVILHAVWRGWAFAEVAALFEQHLPGHYASRTRRDAYLRASWQNAVGYLAGTPTRQTLAALWRWAESRPWPGRGGVTDLLAYRALLQRAWLADTFEPDVSRRDVEGFASVGNWGARGALRRLAEQQLIAPIGRREHATDARRWQLSTDALADCGANVAPARTIDALPGGAELWAALGRAAGMVFSHLSTDSLSVTALSAQTGKHRNTVRASLGRLARYGLAVRDGDGWAVGPRSAAEVADELSAVAAKRRRERRIEDEREAFREVLAANKSG